MKRNFELNIDEIKQKAEDLIRTGQREQARALLARMKSQKIPRARASQMANLARRAGLLHLALQIMSPIIRPKVSQNVTLDRPATDEEKATYAVVLLELGASAEAIEILSQANPGDPFVNLYLGFAHINCWDYAQAIPFLKTYLKVPGLSPYQIMVGQVNLAASMGALGNTSEAKPLLAEITEETKQNGWTLLHKNALELSAQIAIQESEWERAVSFLDRASKDVEKDFNLDDFFIRKWRAIVELLRGGSSVKKNSDALANLSALRTEALKCNHYETVRDCDYHQALALRDSTLALHVYFGTPFERFRQRLQASTKDWLEIPSQHTHQMFEESSSRVFDLRKGEEVNGEVFVKPGKGLHSALVILTSDSYRPFLVGTLHSALFPGEHFNIVSSPRRVTFLIHRLREWLKESQIPLSVVSTDDGYRLQASGPYAFLLGGVQTSSESNTPAHYDVMLEKLREKWAGNPMSAADIAAHLGVSIRSARYFVKWAVSEKRLGRLGTGRMTRYKLRR